jgi:dephospho-CoA kinase
MTGGIGRPYLLGLTGSVGMGKSTTAALFAEAGVPVWDADAAVHRLYAPGGAGASALADLVPDAVRGDVVDRERLRDAVTADPRLLGQLEERIHPLVAMDRESFRDRHSDSDVLLFDIPLLYETGADRWLDGVLVVTAPAEVQRARVLARAGMTPEMLEHVLARQVPDQQKRARADFVVFTDRGIDAARSEVEALLRRIRENRDA